LESAAVGAAATDGSTPKNANRLFVAIEFHMMARLDWTEHVPTLDGELVSVRDVVEKDAPTLCELLNDPAVTVHRSGPPSSVEAFVAIIRWAHRHVMQVTASVSASCHTAH